MPESALVTLLTAFGAVAGVASGQLFNQYMAWIRRHVAGPAVRILRLIFLVIPGLVLGVAAQTVPDEPARTLFFVAFFVGFIAVGVVDFVRWRRTRK
jgi:hypothetical protein